MIIRRLEPADAVASMKVGAVAFEGSADIAVAEERFRPGICWGAFVDGVLCSQMTCLPFEMRFDGQWVKMAGIAGVATLPQYRRRGAVRALFAALFQAMRDAGQAFSVLYPFSPAFYRQFGYETTYRVNRFTMPLALLEQVPPHQTARFHEPGDGWEDVNTVYEQFVAERNLAVRRPETHWREKVLPRDPWKDRRHAYTLYDDAGAPRAYFVFEPGDGDGGRHMRIRDWAAADMEGLRMLFGFFKGYRAHFRALEITMPADLLPDLLLQEYHGVQCSAVWSSMTRVVDVEAALRLMRWPREHGRIVIRVNDDVLDWNAGTFAVDFGAGEAVVTRTHDAPHLVADVRTLARLLLGTFDLGEPSAALLPGLAIATGDIALLHAAFPRKPMGLQDHF